MATSLMLIGVYLGIAAAYLVWAVDAAEHGIAPAWLAVGAIVAFFALPFVLAAASFALAWMFRTPRLPEHRIGFVATLRLYVNEAIAMARSHPRMAFGWWRMRDPRPRSARSPVLLLHGVLCNGGIWRGMAPRLEARGIGPVYALSCAPPQASIEHFAEQVAEKIGAICAATGAAQVVLVGHSMGGLVARAYLRRHGADRVSRLVTLGTPHHGSVHAWMFPGAGLAEMRPGSAWLAELNREEGTTTVPTVALWSRHDSMVAPQASACLAGAENIDVVGVGHNALLEDPGVFALLAAKLEAAR